MFGCSTLHRVLLAVGWCQVLYSSGCLCGSSHYLILPRVSSLVVYGLGSVFPLQRFRAWSLLEWPVSWSSDNIKCWLGCWATGTLTHSFIFFSIVLPVVSLPHSILHEEASHQVHQTRVPKAKGLCLLLSLGPCAGASGWVLNALFIIPSSSNVKLFSKWLWHNWSFHPGSHTLIVTTTSQY